VLFALAVLCVVVAVNVVGAGIYFTAFLPAGRPWRRRPFRRLLPDHTLVVLRPDRRRHGAGDERARVRGDAVAKMVGARRSIRRRATCSIAAC